MWSQSAEESSMQVTPHSSACPANIGLHADQTGIERRKGRVYPIHHEQTVKRAIGWRVRCLHLDSGPAPRDGPSGGEGCNPAT